MKSSKKLISSLLIVLTALSASCTDSAQPGGETAGETTPEETTKASEYQKPNVDYNGAVFTILDYDTDDYFWHAATYSDIHADEDNGDPINDAQFKRNRQVEEELGITLETYPVSGSARNQNQAELRKLILAADNAVDAAFLFGADMNSILAEDGMLIDWNSVPTMNLKSSWWDQNAIETFTFGKQLKVLTGDISLYSAFSPILLFFNKDVAEMYKINDMYDLVREGKWVNEKVYEYCRLVSDDLNGDGAMDENDRYGMAMQNGLIPDMLISSGAKITKHNSQGQLELALMSEKNIDLQSRFYKFIHDKDSVCNASDYYSKYGNPFYELHIPMFANDQLLFNDNQILIAFELRAMETDYGILPTPKADESQENYCTSMSMSWETFLCIPATNDRLEMTGHVVEALGYYSQQYVTSEFIDTTVRTKALRDEDSAEMLELILANKTYDAALIYNWGNIKSIMATENFASSYASSESQIKAEMQKTLDLLG